MTEHKSFASMPPKHPVVPVSDDGYRDLTLEGAVTRDDGLTCYGELESRVRLDLSLEALQFVVDELPGGDGFTRDLRYVLEVGKAYERQDQGLELEA